METATHPDDVRLWSLPVELFANGDGIVIRRACEQFQLIGENVAALVPLVLRASEQGVTASELRHLFPEELQDEITSLITILRSRRILVDAPPDRGVYGESSVDVFYWNVAERAFHVVERMHRVRPTIAGVNLISRRLVEALRGGGVEDVQVIDDPLLRNVSFFDHQGRIRPDCWPAAWPDPVPKSDWLSRNVADDASTSWRCVVAASDYGMSPALRAWNQFCLAESALYFPVLLQDYVGYLGPLVVPKESACFECVYRRRNANLSNAQVVQPLEEASHGVHRAVGFHPSMPSVLGDMAAMELTVFLGFRAPLRRPGRLIEVNLLAGEMTTRRTLKAPRCPACSGLLQFPAASPFREIPATRT